MGKERIFVGEIFSGVITIIFNMLILGIAGNMGQQGSHRRGARRAFPVPMLFQAEQRFQAVRGKPKSADQDRSRRAKRTFRGYRST